MRLARRLSVFLLLLGLAGCQNTGHRPVTIRFWNGFTGPDGRTMLRMVQKFNAENPDVNVLMQRMDWATYYNKLFVAGMGNRAPEVFVIHSPSMVRFSRAGFLQPVDGLMPGEHGIPLSDIDPNVWAGVEYEGKHYGVPLDVHPMGMYFNRDLFRKAGVVDEDGQPALPETREEFLQAVGKITARGKASTRDTFGFVFTNLQSNVYTVMCQYGGEFFSEDLSRCLLNDPRNVEALQFCVDLIHKYKYVPSPENFDAWIGLRQGRVAMAFEGIYMIADLEKQKDLDFGGAPVPLFGQTPATWAGSHNVCLRSDLTGKERDAAWRFIRYLSDNSLDWAVGGQVPVRKSLRNTERFRNMPVQYQFSREIPYVRYMPRVPFNFEFETEFNNAVETALRGSMTPKQALDRATANLNKVLAREKAYEQQREGDL